MRKDMTKRDVEIRMLTKRFLDGETTLEEERRLYELYRSGDSLPPDLLPLREMMLDMDSLLLDKKDEKRISFNGEGNKNSLDKNKRWWADRILAIAASLLLLFSVGMVYYNYARQNECVAYVYGEKVTDDEIVLHEMQSAMASFTTDDATIAMEQQMKEMFND